MVEVPSYHALAELDAKPKESMRPAPRERGTTADPREVDRVLGVAEGCDLFRDTTGEPYVTFTENEKDATMPLSSSGFRAYLRRASRAEFGRSASSDAINAAVENLAADALAGREERVWRRSGRAADGSVVIDLCDGSGSVVVIDADGYRVSTASPVKFHRGPSMKALPKPESGGSLLDLARFINIATEEERDRAVGWLIAALWPEGPWPVLLITGPAGSAKSLGAEFLRDLVDPNKRPRRKLPRDPRDVGAAARNVRVLSYENLSGLTPGMADLFCQMATGAANESRALFTNADEFLVDFNAPVILNGIDVPTRRADFIERTVALRLARIPPAARKTEKKLRLEWAEAQSRLFGALCAAVSAAIRNLPTVELAEHPRMADYAELIVAAEPAVGVAKGALLDSYLKGLGDAETEALEDDPIAGFVDDLLGSRWEVSGGAAQLLADLKRLANSTAAGEGDVKDRWPKDAPRTAEAMGTWLNRNSALLSRWRIEATRTSKGKGRLKRTVWRLRRVPAEPADPTDPTDPPSKPEEKEGKGAAGLDKWTDRPPPTQPTDPIAPQQSGAGSAGSARAVGWYSGAGSPTASRLGSAGSAGSASENGTPRGAG